MDRLKLSDGLIILPAYHLITTVAYLFGYGIRFGSGLRAVFTLTDVANAAVTVMPQVYIVGVGAPLVSILMRRSREVADRFQHPKLQIQHEAKGWKVLAATSGGTLAVLGYGVWKSYQGHAFQITAAAPLVLLLSIVGTSLYLRRFNVNGMANLLGAVIVTVVTVSALMGAASAEIDRYARYDDTRFERLSCKSGKVLSRLGDGYLAVMPSGRKALLNADCAVTLSVPEPQWLVSKAELTTTPLDQKPKR